MNWADNVFFYRNRWNFLDLRIGHWRWLNVWFALAKRKDEEIQYRTEYGRWATLGLLVGWVQVVVCVLLTDKHLIRIEGHVSLSRTAGR